MLVIFLGYRQQILWAPSSEDNSPTEPGENNKPECPICCEKKNIIELPCKCTGTICTDCIIEHITINQKTFPACPFCNKNIFSKEDNEAYKAKVQEAKNLSLMHIVGADYIDDFRDYLIVRKKIEFLWYKFANDYQFFLRKTKVRCFEKDPQFVLRPARERYFEMGDKLRDYLGTQEIRFTIQLIHLVDQKKKSLSSLAHEAWPTYFSQSGKAIRAAKQEGNTSLNSHEEVIRKYINDLDGNSEGGFCLHDFVSYYPNFLYEVLEFIGL